MSSIYDTGIRPLVDDYLKAKSEEMRDYGDYWSASSAGYCMRKNIFDRMKVPHVNEDARKTRVFESGHIFHEWMQRITRDSGMSIAQEIELQDEELMIRGHIDDLVLINNNLVLYDYKTAHSRSFHYAKDRPMSHYHRMQLATYMYMLRKMKVLKFDFTITNRHKEVDTNELTEARILKISKDDLCMDEQQLMWHPELEKEVFQYWSTLNGYWKSKMIPKCTCADYENGFMASPKYNPYYYKGEPCSTAWYEEWKNDQTKTQG